MTAIVSPLAGKPLPASSLIDVSRLITAYFTGRPDPANPTQRVAFGTSGHRGSSLNDSFNENHILAIAQAVCEHRKAAGINGPLYIGIDTHALSCPALATTLEVLAANDVEVCIDSQDGFTPTPVISHAILAHNRNRSTGLADGIVITPSHNPPEDGGFKYNPPHGGPADTRITDAIQARANNLLASALHGVRRIPLARAVAAPTTHRRDYITPYVADLANIIDMGIIRNSGVRIGIDPLGGAAIAYWQPIIERYGIAATVVSDAVDPTFRFMTADWDGRIRMDCSSSYAMARLVGQAGGGGGAFDVAFANDTDADRHGIVGAGGLMNPNHFLAAAIAYLFANRPAWGAACGIGKTCVSSAMIDRVAAAADRPLYEVPVGFKWFVDGLFSGDLGFAGEESAGATFLRQNGGVWTTDKDGLIMGLLAAEITARTGHDPGEAYDRLAALHGSPYYARIDAPATTAQKAALKALSPANFTMDELAGEPVTAKLDAAPGNQAPIGGLKVCAESGWFAARPSGTEDTYKIYAESFRSADHLQQIQVQAQAAIDGVLRASK